MKIVRSMIVLSATGLAAAATATPALAESSYENAETTVVGTPSHHQQGWLTSSGPDAAGRYQVAISIADVDPASEAGWSVMESRVARGSVVLCDISAEQPQVKGYFNGGERRCWSDAREAGLRQMTAAREASRQGRPVAVLGMAAVSVR